MNSPDPGSILAMWAAGLAAGAAVVAYWNVARATFIVLAAAIALLIGGLAALLGTGQSAWLAPGLAVLSIPLRSRLSAIPLAGAAVAWWLSASLPFAATGALALGAITTEMLLGHWYLVDPKLPRLPLKRLAAAGAVAVGIDTVLVQLSGAGGTGIPAVAVVALGTTSVALMIAVRLALKGRSYTGVMAATGLSYLAVLTSLGSVILGRAG
ncbi:MAG: hypothetical protein ACT4OP_02060 [Actinomycetota bacterium]